MIEMGLFIMLPVLLCTIVIKHTLICSLLETPSHYV